MDVVIIEKLNDISERMKAIEYVLKIKKRPTSKDSYVQGYINMTTMMDFRDIDTHQCYNRYLTIRDNNGIEGKPCTINMFNRHVRSAYNDLIICHTTGSKGNVYYWHEDV